MLVPILLLFLKLQGIRYLLLPYIFVVMVHVIILIWECGYVIMMEDFYDFIVLDIIQAGKQMIHSIFS